MEGKLRQDLQDFLGKPNSTNSDKTIIFYFLESGPQCMYVDSLGYDSLEVKKLMIEFDHKKIKSISTILP